MGEEGSEGAARLKFCLSEFEFFIARTRPTPRALADPPNLFPSQPIIQSLLRTMSTKGPNFARVCNQLAPSARTYSWTDQFVPPSRSYSLVPAGRASRPCSRSSLTNSRASLASRSRVRPPLVLLGALSWSFFALTRSLLSGSGTSSRHDPSPSRGRGERHRLPLHDPARV